VSAVLLHVLAGPDEPVLPAVEPVRPEVRTPADPDAAEPALDAVLDEPLDREAAVVGERLRVEVGDRVAAVGATRDVDELQIRKALLEDRDDRPQLRA
jgi:hypothetical protein